MSGLPVKLASELGDGDAEPKWLIEGLWSDAAVGVLGGEPKCCKSFLALDAAVSVASGRPCLRAFAVRRTGSVLVFPAEDPHAVVRRRLDGIAAAAGMSLGDLPVHVITAAKVMLDSRDDRRRLEETVAEIKPVLLVL
ncbi:MAG: AAA family ATPase, partial [Gammaproteobacteria bacterium]|nr:AAA family ATPase [Gammaproteobacteria bacterium]